MLLPAAVMVCAALVARPVTGEPKVTGHVESPVAVLRVHSVGSAVNHLGQTLSASDPDGRRRVSFGVVFDSTGSMYDDLRQLLRGVEDVLKVVVQSEAHTIQNFILVPYHDPVIGPAVVTDDYHQFYDSLKILDVRGGGDCPEMALTGLKLALEEALPNSHIYVFTDASAKDHHLLEEVLSLISDKSPHIVFVLTGDCDDLDGPGQTVFGRIAAVTSGHVFHLKKDSVQQVLQFVRESLRPRKVSLAAVDHDPRASPSSSANGNDSTAQPAEPPAVNFHVDKSLDEFTVSVSGNRPEVTIRESENPNDVTGDVILDLPKVKVVNVRNPKPGRYRVTVDTEDSAFTLRATAISGVTFEFGFTRDEDGLLKDALDRPVEGEPNYLLVRPVNTSDDVLLSSAELTSLQGRPLQLLPLQPPSKPGGLYRAGPFTPPSDLFRVKVHGEDGEGSLLQRETSAVSAVKIGEPIVDTEPEVTGHLGGNVSIPCRVKSYLPVTAGWYLFSQPFSTFNNYSQSSRSRLLNLQLANLTEADAGIYTCSASNALGNVSRAVRLQVLEPPPEVATAKNMTVLEGRPVYLACDVTSDTDYTVTWKRAEWFHGGRPIQRPENTDYLHIPAAGVHSAGRYQCTATNRGGSATSETNLEVHSEPKVSISTPGVVFLPQQQVVIICQAYGKPHPEVVWARGYDATITSSADGRVEVERSLLRISNATSSDEGIYTCTGTNPYGSATRSLYIRYAEPPRVKVSKDTVLGSIGNPVTLRCDISGIPKADVTWRHASAPLLSSGPIKVASGQLHITSVQSSHAGTYSCHAENEFGRDSGTITLQIGSPPKIVIDDYGVELQYGASTSLPCLAVGSPEPTLVWRHADGSPAEADDAGTLALSHVRLSDSGTYSCTATNIYGQDGLTVNVEVLGVEPPTLKNTSPQIHVLRNTSVLLPCEVISANPAPSFRWTHDGLPVALGHGRQLMVNGTLLLTTARPRDAGMYQCIAENVGGRASVSTHVEVQFAPDIAVGNEQLLEAAENDTVFLPCDVIASPPGRVIWARQPQPLLPLDGRLWMHPNNTLQISRVVEEDGGLYTCHVNNTRGDASAKRLLVVHAPPRIVRIQADVGVSSVGGGVASEAGVIGEEYGVETTPEPRLERRELPPERFRVSRTGVGPRPAVTVDEGDDVTILCDLRPDDVARVTWNKPGSQLGATPLDNGGLRFTASEKAEGTYECKASNKYGNSAAPLTLNVRQKPKMSARVRTSTAVLGKDLTLSCVVRGRPKPVITWLRDDSSIVADAIKYRTSGHSLTIHDVDISDGGRYACVATNTKGSLKKFTDVTVQVPPSISTTMDPEVGVREGSPLTLEAVVTGTPQPQIRWLKDGAPLVPSAGVVDDGTGRLEIPSTTTGHSGKYVLVASSEAGETEWAFKVQVVSLVVNDQGWRDSVDVIDGEEYQMDCPVSGDVTGIKWLKSGESLAELFSRTRADQTHVVIGDGGRFLRIPETTAEDSGEYQCVAETPAGSVEFAQRLEVLVPPRFSAPFHQTTERVLDELETLTLDCRVRGHPQPQVVWLRDGQPISDSDVRSLTVSADGQQLTVRGRLGTAGLYSCQAENSAGSTVREFPVRVQVAPRLSGPDPALVTVHRDDSVTLNCTIVASPPPTILWNKDGRNVVSVPWFEPDSGFVYYPRQGEHSERLLVSPARLSDAGTFQCSGKNRLGKTTGRIRLVVNGAPVIADSEEDVKTISLLPGGGTTLVCPVQSFPLATVTWTKDGEVIKVISPPEEDAGPGFSDGLDGAPFFLPENNRRRRRDIDASDLSSLSTDYDDVYGPDAEDEEQFEFSDRFSPGDTSLVLTDVSLADDGLYTCTASNEHGVASLQAKVQVLEAPSILELPLVRHVILHDTAELECETTGTPPPAVAWLKDGVPVLETGLANLHEASGDPSRVLLHLATPEMSGTYTCEAANTAGEATRDIRLVVIEPPQISVPASTNISILEGQSQLLSCDVSSSVEAQVTWLFNGRPISSLEIPYALQNDNHHLLLQEASPDHSGDFTCLASNEAGHDELTLSLRVLVPPYFEEEADQYQGKVHRGVVLRCPAAGDPRPDIAWFQGSTPLTNSSYPGVTMRGSVLRISRLKPEHAGTFRCVASNSVGSAGMEMKLRVLEPPSIGPVPPPLLMVTAGEPLQLSCPAAGRPPPLLRWYVDGTPLPEDSPLRAEDGRLAAAAARTSHSGLYSCLAWNEAGSDRAEVSVAVVVPPVLDDADTEKTVLEQEVAVVRCPLARHDPDAEVTWEKDGASISGNTSSLFVTEDQLGLVLPSVRRADAGLYTCDVQNQAGRDTHQLLLHVHVPPRLMEYPEQLEVVAGSDVELECELDGEAEPPVQRVWRKNGHIVRPDRRTELLPSGGLRLTSVAAADAASFTCRAHSAAGEAVRRTALHVLVLPTARVDPANVTVTVGDPLRLVCDVTGTPEPEVVWLRVKGSLITTLDDSMAFAPYMASDHHIYKESADLEDAGVFRCDAENPLGRASAEVAVRVVSPPALLSPSSPTRLVARASEAATLDCSVTGVPPPQVVWLRGGMELPGRTEQTLLLPSLTPSDAGDYTCIAANDAGSLTREFTLTVLSIPSIMRVEDPSMEVEEGSGLEMACFVESTDDFNITWFRDGERFAPSLADLYHVTDGGQLLRVLRAGPDHAGSYSCRAASVGGTDAQTFTVDVLTPARVSPGADVKKGPDGTYPIKVSAGSEVELECHVRGNPIPEVAWTRDGEALDASKQSSDVSTLHLLAVNASSSGQYSCLASNGIGKDNLTYTVQVTALPKLRQKAEHLLNARLHDIVTIDCDVTGVPEPRVLWSRDGEMLQPQLGKLEMEGSSLVVRDAQLMDSGNFTCLAVNEAGMLTVPFQLVVSEPPRVELPDLAPALEGRDLEVKCSAAGAPTPTFYWLQAGRELPAAGRLRAVGPTLTIEAVRPGDAGDFQCLAKNPAGTDRGTVFVEVVEKPRLDTFDDEEVVETPVGVPLRLTCPVDTDYLGDYRVQWFRGSPSLEAPVLEPLEGPGYRAEDLELELSHPLSSDAGDISCRVTAAAGAVQYLFRLSVLSAPRLTVVPEPVQQLQGQPVVLACEAEGNPPPVVVWFNGTRPIVAETERVKFPSPLELLLEAVQPADTDVLSCLTSNALGNLTQNFTVDVLTLPRVAAPPELEVLAGMSARLPCQVAGNPPPSRAWYTADDTISLPPGGTSANYHHSADTGELVVTGASLGDQGIYTCLASSFVGTARTQTALKVIVPPSIEGPKEVTLQSDAGGSVTLRCPVSGHPGPAITWYKDDEELLEPSGLGDGGHSLTLRDLEAAASGLYACEASNKAGDALKQFHLRVNESPRVQTGSQETEVQLGAPLTLSCPSAGPDVFSTVWLRRGRVAARGDKLVLPSVQRKDAGKYQCISSTMARSRITKYNVRVKEPPRVQKDAPEAATVRPQLGYPLRLVCPIESSAPLRWLRDGQPVSEQDGVITDGRLLFVFSVSESDSGQYTCEASNSAGRASYDFDVRVVVPPFFTGPVPGRLVGTAGEDLTLNCDASGQPAPNVTWYKDGREQGQRRRLLLSPLDVSDDGVYTCTAENEAGRTDRQFIVDVLELPVIAGPETETVRVALGENALLPCATKTQLPLVSWHMSGVPVNLLSPRLTLTPEGLRVSRAHTRDRGKYRCVVSNDAGTAEKFIRLVVSAPAEIEERSKYLVAGEQMTLTCPELGPGSDPDQAAWRWITNTEGKKDNMAGTAPAPYVVNSVERRHARQYTCQATTAAGDVSAVLWNVHVRDSIDLLVEPTGPVTSSEGDQLTLTCQSSAGPGVQVSWYRNDSRLDLSLPRYALSTTDTKGPVVVSSLVVDDVVPADMGTYVCSAKAGIVTENRPVQVVVNGPPRVAASSPLQQQLEPGQRLRLRCDVTGQPAPLLRWFRGQEALQADGRVSIRGATLTVQPFRTEDAAEYMCVAVNALGKAAQAFQVTARMAPTFTEAPKDILVPKMGNFTLQCAAAGAPVPMLTWLKDGRPLAVPARERLTSLSVHLAAPEDAGVYTCRAENAAGERRAGGNVTVFQRLAPPELTPLPEKLRLREGTPGELVCRPAANSSPTIQWQKNGEDFSGDGSTSLEDGGRRLVFGAARPSDAGLYRCVASNAAGTSTRQVKLVVERPPEIMEPPQPEITVPAGSPLILPCVVSGWPRPIVYWLRDGRPISGAGGLRQLTDGSLVLDALEASSAGLYSCVAKNALGTHRADVDVSVEEVTPPPPSAAFLPGEGRQRAEAGRPVTLCRLSDYPSDRYLLRVTRDGVPVPMDQLTVTSPPGSTQAGVSLGLQAVDERHAGSYTCELIDHTNGNMWKQQLELEVNSGWDQWTECSVSCGNGVRVRNRDCQRFIPCQETSPCVLPACTPRLNSAVGSIHGQVNNIPITGGEVISKVTGDPDDGHLQSLITGIETEVMPVMAALLPLVSPAPWLSAQQEDTAQNGLQLTGGLFRKQTDVMFPTGEKLSITHNGLGVDTNGTLTYNTEVKGHLPQLPEVAAIDPAQFRGGLVQTGPGDLYSHSRHFYQAGGVLVPFVVNQTVTYDPSRGQMPDLVQSLDIESSDLDYDVTANRMLFRMTSLVTRKNDSCPAGYTKVMEQGIAFCSDVDECEESPCSHICVNIVSSFRCECPSGFTVRRDRRTCDDIDECAWGLSACPADHQCENTPGSYRCTQSCGSGMRQTGGACYDVDECQQSPAPCEQLCHNTRGNFSCDCYQGYQLVSGGRCVDIDECNQMLGACSHTCINIPGSYRCSCPAGLRLLSNGKCTDIDECATNKHNCYYDEQCVNTAGSFHCVRPCRRGYKLNKNGVCTDIDECAKMMDRCHYSQQCRNLPGSYRCVCPPGFRSDGPGFPCTDIDECSIAGTCQHNCTNMDGGYVCSCPSGYRLNHNKRTCDDIDECSENGVECASDQTCFNQRGSYSCIDVRCPAQHIRDPGTSMCLRPCRRRAVCIPGTWYAEALSYKLLALPAGVRARQDVVELMVSNLAPQTGRGRRPARFRVGAASAGMPFSVRTRDGSGVVYTLRPLPAGTEFKLQVDAFTYSKQMRRWRKTTKFIIVIAVSMYPY